MQLFEILLLFTAVIYLIGHVFFHLKIKSVLIIGILVLPILLHLSFEGYRWQMIPSYLIWGIAMITALQASKKKYSIITKSVKGIGIVLIAATGYLLPSALPVFNLPEPQGEYFVGTFDVQIDLDREELITEDPSDQRKLMVKVWYPSNEKGDIMDPYIDQGGRHGFAQKYGLPNSTFDYLDKVDTHVYRNTKVAVGQFPVLLFSHGYNSKANNYYALLSEIASQGYIIFAVNHTYESTGSTFLDGSETYFDYAYADAIQNDTWKDMEPIVNAFQDKLSYEERHPIVKKGLETYFVREMVERWAQDLRDVVDRLDDYNSSGFLMEKLDTSKIGVFGHSRGGGAAGETLLTDDRIKAGANIDGVQWGRIVNTSFDDPFLFISADWPKEKEDLNGHAYINKSKAEFYEARILNTLHSNFMDIPLMVPFQFLSEAGGIQPELGLEITNKLVVTFFDKHLKNKSTEPEQLTEYYQNLKLEVHR